MTFSTEFYAQVALQLIILAFFTGSVTQSIKSISDKIDKLEKKQDKHNDLISRMAVVESKIQNIEQQRKEDHSEGNNQSNN